MSHRTSRRAVEDDAELPAWASRHLAESVAHPGADGATDLTDLSVSPPPGRRRRHSRRREPSRLRGWALATAAVAAATGSVPLALSTLAREEVPMPRVGTFPVAAPADLGLGTADRAPDAERSAPGPDLAATLPPLTADDAPEVVPTAADRPLPPTARSAAVREGTRAADAPPRRPAPAAATRTADPAPAPAPAPATSQTDPGSDEGDTGDDETPTTRDGATSSTTATTPAPQQDSEGSHGGAHRPSVLDSAVGTVGSLGNRLLG